MNINATLFGQMITFSLLIWFTMKFVWPPLEKALADRREKIAEGLAHAEKGRRSLEEASIQIAEQIKHSKEQAAGIIEEAHRRATLIIDEAKKQATEEQQREIARAKAEIQQLTYAAKETLKSQVVAISVLAAERIIHQKMDVKEQEALLADLVEQL